MDHLIEHVGNEAPRAQRAVFGGNRCRPAGATRRQCAEHPVAGGCAEQEVDLAPALLQLRGQREQRSAAVTAADQQATGRVPGQRERPAKRSGDVDHVPGPPLGQPLGAAAVHGKHELHRPAVIRPHVVDGERSAQHHGRVRPADGQGDELTGLETGRNGWRDQRHRVVGVDPPHRQHGAAGLDRARLRVHLAVGHDVSGVAVAGAARGVADAAPGVAGAAPCVPARAPRRRAACSCRDRTPTSSLLIASMPCTAAASP